MTAELIDVHCHFVPKSFPEGPEQGAEARWPCMRHNENNKATVMIAGSAFREIDHRSWDANVRIRDMDETGVSRQVLSPMPELLSYWFAPSAGLDMCRWMNESIAEMIVHSPTRFSGLAIVPMQDPDLATEELSRVAAAGFSGIEIGSNINGVLLGEAQFDGFFAEAERLGLAIFMHALHPVGAERLKNQPDLVPFAAFPLDTALSAVSLIRAGVPERYPGLRLGFSHGGGAIIPLVHRLAQGARLTGGFGGSLKKTPAQYAAGFYYDNLVYDAGYMSYLADSFAPGHVFCGTDYPYPIMDTNPAGFIESSAPARPDSVRHEAARTFLALP